MPLYSSITFVSYLPGVLDPKPAITGGPSDELPTAMVKDDGHGPHVRCPVCLSRIGVNMGYAFIGDTIICGPCGIEIEIDAIEDDILNNMKD